METVQTNSAVGTAAITGGTIMGATLIGGPAQNAFKSGIPLVLAPTGSMANNGVVTLGTALDRIYVKCFLYLPAGAVAAGVPAAATFYYAEMSSTTVGIVYNNTYTSGNLPVYPTSKTAFATTGPGAFTGVTGAVTVISFNIAANAMGPNGYLWSTLEESHNNSAGSKQVSMMFGATTFANSAQTTTTGIQIDQLLTNAGETARQECSYRTVNSSAGWGITFSQTSQIDTTAIVAATVVLNRGAATDYMIVQKNSHLLIADGA